MPPTIDPISNLINTCLAVIGRASLFLLAGLIGLFVGEASAGFTFEHLKDLVGTFESILSEFDISLIAYCLSWPITILFYCLFEAPIYALVLIVVIITCFVKMVVRDEPPLFWALVLMIFISLAPLLGEGTVYSLIPFGLFMTAASAGLYYLVHRDYPEWIEKIQALNRKDDL